MPKKGKKGKKQTFEIGTHGYIMESVAENYAACAKAIDLPVDQARVIALSIETQMQPTDTTPVPNKLSFPDTYLGPGGARALVCALRGEGPGVSDPKSIAAREKKGDKEKVGPEVQLKEIPQYAVPHPAATRTTLPAIGVPPSETSEWATFTRPIDPAKDDLFNVAFQEPNPGPYNYRLLTELSFAEAGLSDAGGCELSRLLTWQAVLNCGVELEALSVVGDDFGLAAAEELSAALCWSLCAPGAYVSELLSPGAAAAGQAAPAPPNKRPVSLQADFEKSKRKLADIKLCRGQVDDRLGRASDYKVSRAEVQVGIDKRTRVLTAPSPLKRLALTHMPAFDNMCVRVLCHGLASNGSLQELDLSFCGFNGAAAPFLGRLLATDESKLRALSVAGNALGPAGLEGLSFPGLELARSLESLDLSACGIGRPPFQRSEAANEAAEKELNAAWAYFVTSLATNAYEVDEAAPPSVASPTGGKKGKKKKKGGADALPPGARVRLSRLVLLENDLTVDQALALEAQRLPGTALKVLHVDASLPDDLFERIWRDDGAGGGKKKGKKKKKK